ncbi:MAG TPA: hypothetical protein VFU31_12695, partial [Candidatus Binatia bacterium]|nr:hypothetical protein [Candidatus Binatia bacterium]
MSLVLEMPAEEFTPASPDLPPDDGVAQTAADLLDAGDVGPDIDQEQDDPPFDVNTATGGTADDDAAATEQPAEQPAVVEPNGDQPAKKRRGRKTKEPAVTLATEPANVPIDTPAVAEQLAKAETSRSTRKFKIAQVEQEYIEVTLAINAHEDDVEYAKAEIKRLAEQQRELAAELRSLRNDEQWQPDLPLAELAAAVTEVIAPTTEQQPAGCQVRDASPEQDAPRPAVSDWRSVPIRG